MSEFHHVFSCLRSVLNFLVLFVVESEILEYFVLGIFRLRKDSCRRLVCRLFLNFCRFCNCLASRLGPLLGRRALSLIFVLRSMMLLLS
jgi:hypothetical protein